MKKGAVFLASSIIAVMLSGCDEDQQSKNNRLLTFFKDHPVGLNGDVGVFKNNIFGIVEPVVAVFGFVDNSKECQEIANRYNQQEPNTYFCKSLNR